MLVHILLPGSALFWLTIRNCITTQVQNNLLYTYLCLGLGVVLSVINCMQLTVLKQAVAPEPVKKFPQFYEPGLYISAFTSDYPETH